MDKLNCKFNDLNKIECSSDVLKKLDKIQSIESKINFITDNYDKVRDGLKELSEIKISTRPAYDSSKPEYEYIGCHGKDPHSTKPWNTVFIHKGVHSIKDCHNKLLEANRSQSDVTYKYFGLESDEVCYIGVNDPRNYRRPHACNRKCNSGETCGGHYSTSTYVANKLE